MTSKVNPMISVNFLSILELVPAFEINPGSWGFSTNSGQSNNIYKYMRAFGIAFFQLRNQHTVEPRLTVTPEYIREIQLDIRYVDNPIKD